MVIYLIIIALTCFIPLVFPAHSIFYQNVFIHSFIEMLSGILSILVGMFIIVHYKKLTKLQILNALSIPFVILGVSELIHSCVTNTFFFIWTRVLGNLLSAILITMYLFIYLLLKRNLLFNTLINSLILLLSTILLLILSAILPNPLETYVEDINIIMKSIKFSQLPMILNIISGALYYIAALLLIIVYVNIKKPVIVSFTLSLIIFGNSCFIFPGSTLWDFRWWYWHIVRLIAHIVIFSSAFKFYNSIIDDTIMQKTILAEIQEKLITMHKYSVAEGLNALYSHDIKNRLAILKNYIEMLKNFYSDKETLQIINIMESEVNKISECLALYNINIRTKNIQDDLYSIIMDIVKEFKIIAIEKSIHFSWYIPEAMKGLLVPRYIVEAALWNIIINSVEALNNIRGENKMIELYGRVTDNEAIIIVEDNGRGIPVHIKDNLFLPFQTSKSEGLGLGLSYVKFVATALGGCVEIDSHEGSGTRVIFKIPLLLKVKSN